MNQFTDFENELAMVEAEMIIKSIDPIVCDKFVKLDMIIQDAIETGLFTENQYNDFQEIERLIQCETDNQKVNIITMQAKSKIMKQTKILEQVLNCISELITQDLIEYTNAINTKITELTFDNRSMSGSVKTELLNYKRYLYTRQQKYEEVYNHFEFSLKCLVECMNSLD